MTSLFEYLENIHHHLVEVPDEGPYLIHQDILNDYLQLKKSAEKENYALRIVSSYRSIERQCLIWNAKVRGDRKVIDDHNNEIDLQSLSPLDKIFAIMRFSALPGTSRHHLGSDIDIYDENLISKSDLQLTPSECNENGILCNFHQWLTLSIQKSQSFSFYRPYDQDTGGVSPEMWHLSHKKSFQNISALYNKDQLRDVIKLIDFDLKEVVLKNFDHIYDRFIIL